MKVKAANGFARILKTEGIPWVSCDPTNHVNNALASPRTGMMTLGMKRPGIALGVVATVA